MATTDYDVIKEIPGYKVILKAVLKSQIQQLVEQLASNTDEESVILTASVADGTLSHLGSESGKGFLEDHEDIKSQFLGFCLRSHHKRKQEEKERQAAELLEQSSQASPGRYPSPAGPYTSPSPRFTSRNQGSVHPVALTRASPGAYTRSPGVRHEPYTVSRPPKRTLKSLDTIRNPPTGPSASPGMVMKLEPGESSDISIQNESDTLNQDKPSLSGQSPSQQSDPSHLSVPSDLVDQDDDVVSESSTSTIQNESFSEGLGVDSDTSNTISDNVHKQSGDSGEIDANVSIKLEAINENEMDLEITGVEPGRPSISQDNWDPNISMGMNFDPTGAMGNQGDFANQGYNSHHTILPFTNVTADDAGMEIGSNNGSVTFGSPKTFSKLESKEALRNYSEFYAVLDWSGTLAYMCTFKSCEKIFKTPRDLLRHIRTHTKEKPYICRFCSCTFSRKDRWKTHEMQHMMAIDQIQKDEN